MRMLPYNVISSAHYVELDKAGWREKSFEFYACAALRKLNNASPVQQIKKEILKGLFFEIKLNELNGALASLVQKGEVVKTYDDRYKLSAQKAQDMKLDEEKGIELEAEVKKILKKKF